MIKNYLREQGQIKKWLPWLLVVISLPIAFYIFESGKQNSKFFGKKSSPQSASTNAAKDKHNKTGKKHKKRRKSTQRIVNVLPLEQSDFQPTWQTTGIVIPAESVKMVAEVSGKIEKVNSLAHSGALIKKNDWLVELDQTDYLLNLRTAQAQLIQAEANLKLEMADQQLAKEELSLVEHLDQSIEVAFVLREPQLAAAKARVEIAVVNLEKSEVALQRTQVKMPFTGKVVSRAVGRGSRVGQNSLLFEVINVEQFYLEIKIPRSFLPLLDKNKVVELSQSKLWGPGIFRLAKVLSVLPELDARDRQVKVLLAIENPLLLKAEVPVNTLNATPSKPLVFVNDFLTVSLQGRALDNVWVLKDSWLQSDNSIWVVDKKSTLQKRAVSIIFKGRDKLYVQADFKAGDRALDEKPGIASAGLVVKVKSDIIAQNAQLAQEH